MNSISTFLQTCFVFLGLSCMPSLVSGLEGAGVEARLFYNPALESGALGVGLTATYDLLTF